MLNKQQRICNYQNFIKSDNFGQHTWTTLFTYRTNCECVIQTIELYANLTQQNIPEKKYNSLDTLRIKQQFYLDTISKICILIESFLVLIDSLSHSYSLVSKNILEYNQGDIRSITKNINSNPIEYDMGLVLGLYDISKMKLLSKRQKMVLEKAYYETQKIAISKLKNLAEFYDEFYLVYLKTKHGLTYYSGQILKSSHDNELIDSLLICMDKKTNFDKKVLEHFISKKNKEPIYFNLLSYVKFNEILRSRLNSVLGDLQNLIRYVCDNHLTHAINCGEYYLPFKKENNKIRFNFSPDIFTSKFSENDFDEMFKMILAEMNTEIPPLPIQSKTNEAINKLLNDRGIARVKLTEA